MSNRVFVVFVVIVAALGLLTGYQLAFIERVQPYKLLNIAGLIYDLLGVLVLSEMIESRPKWQKVSVKIIAPGVLWFQTIFPFGASAGAHAAAFFRHAASGPVVTHFALMFGLYSLLPLTLLDATVAFPRIKAFKGDEPRWRRLGLFLVLSGVALQLYSAVLGFQL